MTRERELDYVITTGRIKPHKSMLGAWESSQKRLVIKASIAHLIWFCLFFAVPMFLGKSPFDRTGSSSLSITLTNMLFTEGGTPSPWLYGFVFYAYLVLLILPTLFSVLVPPFFALRFAPGPYCYRRLLLQRCPSCDFSLMEITPEADGCKVCPECGGAWRIPAEAITPGTPTRSRWD